MNNQEILPLPKAIAESELNIGGLRLRVYVLDNGMRLIDADDFHNFFDALAKQDITITHEESLELAKAVRGI